MQFASGFRRIIANAPEQEILAESRLANDRPDEPDLFFSLDAINPETLAKIRIARAANLSRRSIALRASPDAWMNAN